jgi:hypothetical protein
MLKESWRLYKMRTISCKGDFMRYTNVLNLPGPVAEAVKYNDYDPGESDISVTSLIGPSLLHKLRKENEDNIVVDVADQIFSLTGKALHEVLRRANLSGIAEQRLYAEVNGYKISGQFDHLSLHSDIDGLTCLEDYKETSVWSVLYGNDSWEPQLNVYNFLVSENGFPSPDKLKIIAFLRDHQKSKAKLDPQYPQFRVHPIEIPMWDRQKTLQFIEERLAVHFEHPPTCTDKERWKKDDTFAVMKTGRKTALRVLNSRAEAETWMKVNQDKKPTHIEARTGGYVRCEGYCECATFCPIYNNK